MNSHAMALYLQGFPDRPGLDIAVGATLLDRTSRGLIDSSFRLTVPGRVLAFGKRDTNASGYAEAVQAARAMGFEPVERLAGGRAAVFHEGTLAFGWTTPLDDPRPGIRRRFEWITDLILAAFRRLGADAAVGEIPGEYCPGEFSINVKGRLKVMGVGQRLARQAAYVGGVVVVQRADLVNRALTPVYEALGLDWDPSVTGSLAAIDPGLTPGVVCDAIVAELVDREAISEEQLDSETVEAAEVLAPSLIPDRR